MLTSHLKGTKHKTVATAARSAVPIGEFMTPGFSKYILRCCFFFHSRETDKFKLFSERGTPQNTSFKSLQDMACFCISVPPQPEKNCLTVQSVKLEFKYSKMHGVVSLWSFDGREHCHTF